MHVALLARVDAALEHAHHAHVALRHAKRGSRCRSHERLGARTRKPCVERQLDVRHLKHGRPSTGLLPPNVRPRDPPECRSPTPNAGCSRRRARPRRAPRRPRTTPAPSRAPIVRESNASTPRPPRVTWHWPVPPRRRARTAAPSTPRRTRARRAFSKGFSGFKPARHSTARTSAGSSRPRSMPSQSTRADRAQQSLAPREQNLVDLLPRQVRQQVDQQAIARMREPRQVEHGDARHAVGSHLQLTPLVRLYAPATGHSGGQPSRIPCSRDHRRSARRASPAASASDAPARISAARSPTSHNPHRTRTPSKSRGGAGSVRSAPSTGDGFVTGSLSGNSSACERPSSDCDDHRSGMLHRPVLETYMEAPVPHVRARRRASRGVRTPRARPRPSRPARSTSSTLEALFASG